MRRIALLLTLLLLLCCAVAAAEENSTGFTSSTSDSTGNYTYTVLKDGSAEIVYYLGFVEDLEIPAKLDGLPVTSIGDRAFYLCSSLTSVTIPDSITSIGISPFFGCRDLQTIQVSPNHPLLATIDGVLFKKAKKHCSVIHLVRYQ